MNRLIVALIAAMTASAMTTAHAGDGAEPDSSLITVMSYNVHNGIGLDGHTDYARTGRTIGRHSPDIVAVQEVDSATARSGGRYVLAELGAATGMRHTFAPAIDFQGGKYGIGILSREDPVSVRRIALPGSEEARVMLIAEFPRFTMVCTHLSLTAADAMTATQIIMNETAGAAKPLIIAGDFNLEPDSEPMRLLRDRFSPVLPADQHTFPADTPEITIDYIMTDIGSGIVAAPEPYVAGPDELASDHRPIVARLRLPQTKQTKQ